MRQLNAGLMRTDVAADSIEVADVVRTLQWQWRVVIGFLAVGIIGAGAVVMFAPRRFEGRATILARAATSESGGSILGRISSISGLISGGGLSGLPSPFESELQVLRSRAVAGRVVDSLELQFSVRDPRGIDALSLFESSQLAGRFKPRKYRFERSESGSYVVRRAGQTYALTPGQPGTLDIGSVTLRPGNLPRSFMVKVYDREDAITRLLDRMEANKAGGEVARVVYRGEDSLSAAAVPNLVVEYYLERRKTVDRGTNQRRLEFVSQQYDSTARELAATERSLREYQEASGVLDAEMMGRAWLDGAVALRESLTTVLVDESSVRHLLQRNDSGAITPRQLSAYPAFMRGTSVASLAGHLTDLESQRIKLLERRTERDPDVIVLDQSIKKIEDQILALARSYASSVTDNRIGLTRQLDSLQKKLMALPAAAERGGRLQRDVERLTAIFTALQAQVVEARLAAIGEGGEVRQIDVAVPARKPAFPDPWLTMGIGTFGGLVAGLTGALFMGWFGRWLRDPVEIERTTGVAVQRWDPDAPLLLTGSGQTTRTVLVAPLGDGAQAGIVAQRLAQSATARSLRTNLLDLTVPVNGNGAGPANPSSLIEKLESEVDMVVVQLPGLMTDTAIGALRENRPVLLVAPPGPVDRGRLGSALDLLHRLGVPCAGVVVSERPNRRVRV